MWQRYRSAVGTAFLTSAVIGVLIGVGIFLFGNPDYREQSGWGGLLYTVSLATGVCIVTAGSAVLGGLIALMLCDRELTRPTEQRVNIAGGGAVIGAATLWLIVGGVAAATGTAGAIGLFGFLAVIAALVTWFPAAIALDRAEQGSLRTKRAENE